MSNRATAIRTDLFPQDADRAPLRARPGASPVRIRHAGEGDRPAANLPAQLQLEVAAALAQGAFDPRARYASEDRWSARQTLALVFVSCGSFWGLALWAMSKLF